MCEGNSAKTDRSQTLTAYGDLNSIIKQLSGTGKTLTGAGASDTGAASKYFSDIVSGNPSKVMAAAAPEVNAIKGQATEQKKEIANLGGNRTGGTNQVTQDISTKARGQIADVISKQRTGAATQLGRIGAEETSSGIGATSNAGATAGTLADASIKSRSQSQQIHDQAVQQWASVAADLLFA